MGWQAFRFLPRAVLAYARLHAGRGLSVLPWWPYPAIEHIARLITRDSILLEYGIGMSTLWLAERGGTVYGIEDAPEWYAEVAKRAQARGLTNLTLSLRDSNRFPNRGASSDAFNEEFSRMDAFPGSFDFVIIDGAARWRCVEQSLPRLKPGGHLYFDDSDADKDCSYYTTPGTSRAARRLLLEAEHQGIGTIQFFRGLAPGNLHATEGMLFNKALP